MKISTINTIETSSLCNRACKYCPAMLQEKYRKTGLMEMHVFKEAIKWVKHFTYQGTQQELNLFGVGEPLLNPYIVEMVREAKGVMPLNQPVHLNTNGSLMTEQLAMKLKIAGINHIDLTAHDAYDTARCIRILRKAGIEGKISLDFAIVPNDWAGQVNWFKSDTPFIFK